MSKFNKIFEKLAMVNDRSIIWNNWLDYCINLNLLSNQKYNIDFKGNEEAYAEMLECWLLELSKKLEEKPYYDMLGLFYEELDEIATQRNKKFVYKTEEEIAIMQEAVEYLNSLLDSDLKKIKDHIFPGLWRFGIGMTQSDQFEIRHYSQELKEESIYHPEKTNIDDNKDGYLTVIANARVYVGKNNSLDITYKKPISKDFSDDDVQRGLIHIQSGELFGASLMNRIPTLYYDGIRCFLYQGICDALELKCEGININHRRERLFN